MATTAAVADKAQEKSKEKHKRYRSDRYSKMLERQRILRECETVSALAKAEAILKAEKEYLMKHGVRVNWPGKKALEEAYKQQQTSTLNSSSIGSNSSSFPLSTSSTSISYSSNIHIDPKLATAYGGSLPASPRHTPLGKAPAIPSQHYEPPPMGRISLASASPVRGNPLPSDNSFNFSFNENNSTMFKQNPQLTSTPIAKQPQQKQPSSFLFQTAASVASSSNVPVSEPPKTQVITSKPFTGFAKSASNSTDSGKFSSDNATGRLDAESAKTPLSDRPFGLSDRPFGSGGFTSGTPLFGQLSSSSTTTVTSLPASTFPSSFVSPPPPPSQPFQKQPQSETSKSAPVHKLPTRLTPSAPITAAFKPPAKVLEQPEAPKAVPVAVRWLKLQRDYYRKFVASVKEFIDDPGNGEIRRMIKMEVGNSIDKALQKRPTDDELNTVLAEFSQYFNRLITGETIKCTLMAKKTFIFDSKNEKMLNYLIEICSRRIIEMIRQDPSLTDVAKLVHSIISLKIPTFKKIFRQLLTNTMFIIQLTSDDLIITLDEKLTAEPGYLTLNCLDSDKSLLRFLCLIEMYDTVQVKNLSDLCGIRLLYELSVACNTLPQLPVTTLSVLFEVMQTAGPAFTSETCQYRKEFLQIVFPRLRSLVNEDITASIDGICVRLAEPSIATHLHKMHAIVRQRVLDALEKIGIK